MDSFYKKVSPLSIKCTACAHYCTIPKGAFGLCGVRKNVGNKIKPVNHSRPCSLSLDPIEKKPLYHFLPASKTLSIGFFGCNFKCDFCQNFDIAFLRNAKAESESNKLDEVSPKKFVELAVAKKAKSIAFTYNEPSINPEYNLDAIRISKKQAQKVKTVYVSNGYASSEQIKSLAGKKTKLDAINIDLKSFNDSFYQKTCGAKLENVLKSIRAFHKAGVWVELTTLIIPTMNDSNEELSQIASWIYDIDKNIPWHVSAFFPTHKMTHLPPTPNESISRAMKIGKSSGLNFVYGGNTSVSGVEDTHCPKCNALLIKRNGFDAGIIGMEKNICISCGEKVKGVFE